MFSQFSFLPSKYTIIPSTVFFVLLLLLLTPHTHPSVRASREPLRARSVPEVELPLRRSSGSTSRSRLDDQLAAERGSSPEEGTRGLADDQFRPRSIPEVKLYMREREEEVTWGGRRERRHR